MKFVAGGEAEEADVVGGKRKFRGCLWAAAPVSGRGADEEEIWAASDEAV